MRVAATCLRNFSSNIALLDFSNCPLARAYDLKKYPVTPAFVEGAHKPVTAIVCLKLLRQIPRSSMTNVSLA